MNVFTAAVATLLVAVPITTSIKVLDGDTIVWKSKHVRLLHFDAPEIFHSRCPAEKVLGLQAKTKLVELLLPEHHPKIAVSKRADKYGRVLAELTNDAGQVSDEMITAGLAVAYEGHGPRKDWCQ